MSPLDAWDLAVLTLALDLLGHHTDVELANARNQRNGRKQQTLLAMHRQIATVSTKLRAMRVSL